MLSKDETIKETQKHINRVEELMNKFAIQLNQRGILHDQSKLHEPELSIFCEYTEKLKTSTYGSEEYKTFLKEMKPTLDHHYANNRHHPEYFEKGIDDMNLVDLIEMLCDWKAASERHDNGDIYKSIELNEKRFNISPQLKQILINTAEVL